jgi:hypothetical protein
MNKTNNGASTPITPPFSSGGGDGYETRDGKLSYKALFDDT